MISKIILGIGVLGFSGVIASFIIPNSGYWYWFSECVALSSMIWYTPAILIYSYEKEIRTLKEYRQIDNEISAWYLVVGSFIPVIFLFMLPVLSWDKLKYTATPPAHKRFVELTDYLNTP